MAISQSTMKVIVYIIILLIFTVIPPSVGASYNLSSTGYGVLIGLTYVGVIFGTISIVGYASRGLKDSTVLTLAISAIVLYVLGVGLAFGLYLPSSSSSPPNSALPGAKPVIFTNNNQIADLTKIASDFTSISTSINTASNTDPLVAGAGIDNSNTLLSLFKTRLSTVCSNVISQIQIDIKAIPVNDIQYPGSTTAIVQHTTNVNKYYALFTSALTTPSTL